MTVNEMDRIEISVSSKVTSNNVALAKLIQKLEQLKVLQASFTAVSSGLNEITKALDAFGATGSSAQVNKAVDNLKQIARPVGTRVTKPKTDTTTENGIQKGDNTPVSVPSSTVEATKEVAKNTKETAKATKAINKDSKAASENVDKSKSSLSTLMASVKRIAFYRLIRTVIKAFTQGLKEGMDNMYKFSQQHDKTFSESMDKLATSGNYLKNSLGAMIAPLMNVIAPIVEKIVDFVVEIVNRVNQALAALSGATHWTKALKTEIKYSADNAKELQRQLLGIDEINALSDNKNDSDNGAYAFVEIPFDKATIEGKGFLGFMRKLGDQLRGILKDVILPLSNKLGAMFNGDNSPGGKMLKSLGDCLVSLGNLIQKVLELFGLGDASGLLKVLGDIAVAIGGVAQMAQGLFGILDGIFSLDGSKLLKGLEDLGTGFLNACFAIAGALHYVFANLFNNIKNWIGRLFGQDWSGSDISTESPSWADVSTMIDKMSKGEQLTSKEARLLTGVTASKGANTSSISGGLDPLREQIEGKTPTIILDGKVLNKANSSYSNRNGIIFGVK